MKHILYVFLLLFTNYTFGQRLYPIPQDGKWGFIDQSGKIIVEPKYYSAAPFVDGLSKISMMSDRDEYLYGFVDGTGREVIPPKFANVSDFQGGIARVKIRDKFYYIRRNGTVLTEQAFDEIYPATNGVSLFKRNNKYGYATTNGTVFIDAIYTTAYPFSAEKLAIVSTNEGRNKEYGFINLRGDFVVAPEYINVKRFTQGFGAIQIRRRWQIIDTKGRPITDTQFDDLGEFSNGLINVKNGGLWGYMNSAGEMIIPPQFKEADRFSNGLAIVSDGKLYSYINTSGKMVAPYSFTRATRFDGRLARVAQGNKNGFMNAEGRFNLTDRISSIGSFQSGRARMRVGSYYGYYSPEGRLAINPTYLYASDFMDDLAVTATPIAGGYNMAYINKSGNPVFSWKVISKPILARNDVFYSIIYPSVPFYRDSDPSSRIIINANYGESFTKSHQRTATPIIGHGLSGLLYAAEYYARPGFIFSEAISLYTPPKVGIGISTYFRENIGVLSQTGSPTAFTGPINMVFLNGATLQRTINRGVVEDRYFVPFMKVSESFFLLTSAMGYPSGEYPSNSSATLPNYFSAPETARFTGRKNSKNVPSYYTINVGRSRLTVNEDRFGIKIEYFYPIPKSVDLPEMKEPVFVTDPKNLEQPIIEPILTNELLEQGFMTNSTTHTELIIEHSVNTTNSVDITDAVILDQVDPNNRVQIIVPVEEQNTNN